MTTTWARSRTKRASAWMARAARRGGELSLLRVGLVVVQEAGHAGSIPMALIASTLRSSDSNRCWLSAHAALERAKGLRVTISLSIASPNRTTDAQKADHAEKRMHQDHRENEDRRPRKIEQSGAGGAAEEGAEAADVAPGLRRCGRIAAQGRLHGCDKNRGLQAIVEPDADPGEHRAAQGLQDRMHGQRHDRRSRSASRASRDCGSTRT